VGLLEVILIGWIIKPKGLREHANSVSHIKIGSWWDITIKFVTPAILIYMTVQNILTEINSPYGGYDLSNIFTYGWSVIGAGIIIALILAKKPWKDKKIENYEENDEIEVKELVEK
ncbi:MAG: sodium-dependent transporter, partial [Clostridium sp.]